MSNSRYNSKGGRRRGWFARHRVLAAILSLMAVGLLAGGYAVYRSVIDPLSVLKGNFTPAPTYASGDPGATGGLLPADSAASELSPTEEPPPDFVFQDDTVNFLILGTDMDSARIAEGWTTARTDCIMIVSLNLSDPNNPKAALVSIPRDTYVKIYNDKNKLITARNRINAAFQRGGKNVDRCILYAQNTVNQFLAQGRIPIDHHVLFNMDLVKDLIDAVGGVDVDVEIDCTINGFVYKPGTMHLGGAEALAYARDRHHSKGGDIGRVGHQQDVIIALLKKLKDGGNIVKVIPQLFTDLHGEFTTDIDNLQEIAALAYVAKNMNLDNIQQYTVDGSSIKINGASMLVADQTKKAKTVQDVFGIKNAADGSWTLAKLRKEIEDILNAGQTIVGTADSLLNDNAGYYTQAEAAPLKAAIAVWQKAADRNDADGMNDAVEDVQTQYDILSELVKPRVEAIGAAAEQIQWANDNLEELQGWISAEDLESIQEWVDAVQQCVDARNYTGVGAAVDALVSQATPIFDAARVTMSLEPT
jgi:LCP family protein required for cell wall assembly